MTHKIAKVLMELEHQMKLIDHDDPLRLIIEEARDTIQELRDDLEAHRRQGSDHA